MSEKELTELTLKDLIKEHKSMWNYWQGHDEAVKEFRRRHIQGIERIVYVVMSNLNDQWGIRTLKEFAQNV